MLCLGARPNDRMIPERDAAFRRESAQRAANDLAAPYDGCCRITREPIEDLVGNIDIPNDEIRTSAGLQCSTIDRAACRRGMTSHTDEHLLWCEPKQPRHERAGEQERSARRRAWIAIARHGDGRSMLAQRRDRRKFHFAEMQ